jgi:hypothetical protein
VLLLGLLLAPAAASAQRATSQEALSRLEETLAQKLEEGGLTRAELTPAIVVSTAAAFEETRAWYPTAALAALVRVTGGADGLRSCEACMAPRLHVQQGRMEQLSTALSVEEIVRADEALRGGGAPARTAVWLDETPRGVSLRVIDLRNSRVVLAENFDPSLLERARSRRTFDKARELDRRARGDALTHLFIDVALYPGQHVSLDWSEQWGDGNNNLAGVSLSAYDPIAGVGAHYYRVMPAALNITVGAKVFLSVPTAVATGFNGGQAFPGMENLLTATLLARVPIATSNYGVILSASTNGRVGIGVSLMNLSLLPFLP